MASNDFVTLDTFRTRFPQFTTTSAPDDLVNEAIADADEMFDVCRWGGWLQEGSAYYVAWKLVFDNPKTDSSALPGNSVSTGGSTSTVTMKKAGDLQKQNSAQIMQAIIDNPYLANKYGQRYWWLVSVVGMGAVTV